MKLVRLLVIASCLLILLSGCINVPIGDGSKIKIGKDGFTITDSDGEKHKVEYSEEEIVVKDEKSGENKLQINKDGMQYEDSDGKEQSITMEEDEGNIKIDGKREDGAELSMQMGEDIEIPSDFPTDIPLTKDAKLSLAGKDGNGIGIAYSSNESREAVEKIYDDFVANQKGDSDIESGIMEEADFFIKTYQIDRGTETISINISEIENKQVEVVIIVDDSK